MPGGSVTPLGRVREGDHGHRAVLDGALDRRGVGIEVGERVPGHVGRHGQHDAVGATSPVVVDTVHPAGWRVNNSTALWTRTSTPRGAKLGLEAVDQGAHAALERQNAGGARGPPRGARPPSSGAGGRA